MQLLVSDEVHAVTLSYPCGPLQLHVQMYTYYIHMPSFLELTPEPPHMVHYEHLPQ